MRVPIRKRETLRSEDSMTPLIDVVFLLLIFFVCASVGQVAESLMPTELDSGSVASLATIEQSPAASRLWLYLDVDDSGTLSLKFGSETYPSFAALSEKLYQLAELTPDSPVILDIGANVPLEAVVDAWDTCNRAGFESINFATEQNPLAP